MHKRDSFLYEWINFSASEFQKLWTACGIRLVRVLFRLDTICPAFQFQFSRADVILEFLRKETEERYL